MFGFSVLGSQPNEHRARYIKYRFLVALFRSIVRPAQWLEWQKQKLHDGVRHTDFSIPSRDPQRHIKIHLYEPEPDREGTVTEIVTKPTPVLINLHGSAHLLIQREF